ncbi:MAG: Gfo/Idh/MocA family oxidoreductase [Sedimentisphaerales bacterium]|nr:Gfo/Idh/MocA family oxidoreductase [Sedimentisphaerales bacterium]
MANKPIKMVLAGAGFIGREHLKSAKGLELVEYVGIADPCEVAAKEASVQYNLPCFSDLSEAIASLKPDAVDVCVPTPYHLAQVEICAEHGVNVLCEKPMEITLDAARRMAQIAEDSGIRLMIAQVMRFWPEYRYVREASEDGRYGKIVSVDCKRLSSPPGWNSWLMDETKSGGAAIDLQIHDMDFVLQLLGTPRSLTAWGRDQTGGVNALVTKLDYDNGIPVFLETSFLMPASYPFRMFFKVEFEEATFEMDFWRPKGQRLKIYPVDGDVKEVCVTDDAYCDEIDYFAKQLAAGKPFDAVPLDESIRALELCCASVESCRVHKPVIL